MFTIIEIMKQVYSIKYQDAIKKFIQDALSEDVGAGDVTALACLSDRRVSRAKVISREPTKIAGIALSQKIFQTFDSKIHFSAEVKDGDQVKSNQVLFNIEGPERAILSAERVALNSLQRMSGIATLTDKVQTAISHTKCKVLDTRKTTPNARVIEKWAVLIGGGVNHRMGLYDAIMIKDNHIDFCGSVELAIENVLHYLENNALEVPIIVETRSLVEIEKCLPFSDHIDRVLLDNMKINTLNRAVDLIGSKTKTEASGGITLENVAEIAETGVDFISMGSIIYDAKIVDMSLKATVID